MCLSIITLVKCVLQTTGGWICTESKALCREFYLAIYRQRKELLRSLSVHAKTKTKLENYTISQVGRDPIRIMKSNCCVHRVPLKNSDQMEAKIRSVLFSEQKSFDIFTDYFWTGQNWPHFGLSKKTPTWVSAKALPASCEVNGHPFTWPQQTSSLFPSHGFGCMTAGIPSLGKEGL